MRKALVFSAPYWLWAVAATVIAFRIENCTTIAMAAAAIWGASIFFAWGLERARNERRKG